MQELTPQQHKKLGKIADILSGGNLAIAKYLFEIEERFDDVVEEIKKNTPDLAMILESIRGKDGENYVLSDGDRQEIVEALYGLIDDESIAEKAKGKIDVETLAQKIADRAASKIKVPVVEKITERTETIKEIPIVTNTVEVKEVAVGDSAEDIRNKLELLEGDERLDMSAIKDLKEELDEVRKIKSNAIFVPAGATTGETTSAGGMSTVITVSGTINDSNVTFTASTEPDLLVINGGISKQTGGAITWTYSAGTVTLSSAVGTGGTIFGLSKSTLDKCVVSILINDDISLTTGDGKAYWRVPEEIDGWILTEVFAARASGTGVPSFQVHNVTAALDMLSTNVTIDSGEVDSTSAATPAVINTSNDEVSGADRLRFDCDVAGTSTFWSEVQLVFERP